MIIAFSNLQSLTTNEISRNLDKTSKEASCLKWLKKQNIALMSNLVTFTDLMITTKYQKVHSMEQQDIWNGVKVDVIFFKANVLNNVTIIRV